jgi:RNA polymerase sigma factor for flagellar operon FliA
MPVAVLSLVEPLDAAEEAALEAAIGHVIQLPPDGEDAPTASGDRPSRADRDELVLQYQPLVKYLAARLQCVLPPGFDREDLISHGTMGLIEAIDRYEPNRGIKLTTFAATRIRGAMLDALRTFDPVPRSVRQHARRAELAAAQLTDELGREPTSAEVARALEMPVAKYREVRANASWRTVSLDGLPIDQDHDGSPRNGAESIASDAPALSDPLEARDLREALALESDRLPIREREIIRLRFYENLTGREISDRMGISESRVFQLLRSALEELRNRLESSVTGEPRALPVAYGVDRTPAGVTARARRLERLYLAA